MELDKYNYFSRQANMEYMSVSQFKAFKDCEAAALAEIQGVYKKTTTKSLLMGSYVDAVFSDEEDEFIAEHPEIFRKDGSLKADYVQADNCIVRAIGDPMFKSFMNGEKQVVMTGELFGIQWKIKVDSLHDNKIVDLKLMRNLEKVYKDGEYKTFVDAWGYDLQGFVYQQIVKANTGKQLPFYLAVITKEEVPDIDIIHIPQWRLNSAGELIKYYVDRYDAIKNGEIAPERCGKCNYCRMTKLLKKPTEYEELLDKYD